MQSSHALDRTEITFDDHRAVANAGLMLTSTLAERLGLEALVDQLVDLGDRPGGARPGRKVMTLVQSLVAGGDCIDDADVLRSGSTEAVLPHRVLAPSTLGTFLRAFTFGHVRQLDRVAEAALRRAWAAGAGPRDQPMTMDLDSTVCEVHGHRKGGAAYGHTRQLGYHPLLATRADTGEVLHARQRKGSANTARGAVWFLGEVAARVRRAGVTGALTVRADSGFWSDRFIERCRRLRVAFSITVRQIPQVKDAIASIEEGTWVGIDYTEGGVAQVAETTYKGDRLIVRRTRLVGPQAELWPDWRYHAFVTDRSGSAVELDQDHRRHAVMELAIRDLKEGSGLNHCPFRTVLRQRGLAGHRRTRPQPPAVGGCPRAGDQGAGGGEDRPAAVPGRPRPAHPLGPPAPAASACRVAMAGGVRRRPSPPPGVAASGLTAPCHYRSVPPAD